MTRGELDESGQCHVQPVSVPPGCVLTEGGLEVSTSSTQLHSLTDALHYLHKYPYECLEQRCSRVLARPPAHPRPGLCRALS